MKANDFIAEGAKIRPALEEYNKSMFSHLKEEQTEYYHYYVYYLDGQRVWLYQYWTAETAERNRQAHIGREFARLEVEIMHPLYAVIEKWKEIARMRLPHDV